MMNRRGALRSLLGAPFVAQAATKAAADSAEGVGMEWTGDTLAETTSVEPHRPSPLEDFLRKQVSQKSPYRPRLERQPPEIRTKRSWSDTFKEHVSQKRVDDYHHWDNLLDTAMFGRNPVEKAKALAALVERFGEGGNE